MRGEKGKPKKKESEKSGNRGKICKMKTKKLTTKEYQGLPFSLHDTIQNLANKEAEIWWGKSENNVVLPKFIKEPKLPKVAGMVNFFKSSVMQFRP